MELEIHEITAPEPYRCYIEFEGHWRASRLAIPMIHADLAIVIEPQSNNMYRIYFKKDVSHIIERILEGSY